MENKLKSKKILYIITQTQWGGAQKYILDLVQYFGQANEVHIAYGEMKNPDPYFLSECQKLQYMLGKPAMVHFCLPTL